jgi:hypothetical protein
VESTSVRAVLPQTVLRLLREREPRVAESLGDRYAPIDEPFKLGWVSGPLYLALLEELRKALGDQPFRELYRDAILNTLENRALRGLIEAGIRLLGATPAGLLKWTPRLWNTLFIKLGQIEHIPEPQPHVVWRNIPVGFVASGTSVLAFAAAFDALFVMTRHTGHIDIRQSMGEITFTVLVD